MHVVDCIEAILELFAHPVESLVCLFQHYYPNVLSPTYFQVINQLFCAVTFILL